MRSALILRKAPSSVVTRIWPVRRRGGQRSHPLLPRDGREAIGEVGRRSAVQLPRDELSVGSGASDRSPCRINRAWPETRGPRRQRSSPSCHCSLRHGYAAHRHASTKVRTMVRGDGFRVARRTSGLWASVRRNVSSGRLMRARSSISWWCGEAPARRARRHGLRVTSVGSRVAGHE